MKWLFLTTKYQELTNLHVQISKWKLSSKKVSSTKYNSGKIIEVANNSSDNFSCSDISEKNSLYKIPTGKMFDLLSSNS